MLGTLARGLGRLARPDLGADLSHRCLLQRHELLTTYQSKYAIRKFRLAPVCMGRRSSKIATRKGAQDKLKAKLYGKVGKLIVQAVKAGGPDPGVNMRLKEVLLSAKNAQIPKEILDRNIKRASDKSQADYTEVVYEAYGAGGTGFIMECLTDNVNRSASEVRSAVAKCGGKMADPGSVMFNFQRQGLLLLEGSISEEQAFEAAMDAGADDVQPAGSGDEDAEQSPGFKVLTSVEDFSGVSRRLVEMGLPVNLEASGLVYSPLQMQELSDELFEQNEALFERLMGVDDVDAVHSTIAGLQR